MIGDAHSVFAISIKAHAKEWYLKDIGLDRIGHRTRCWTTAACEAMTFDVESEAEIVAMMALDDGEDFQIKPTTKR